MSTVSTTKRETSSDASSRLRRAHPTVWSIAVPVGALAVWEVISVVLVVALPDTGDGVLSIAADLLIAPALVWFYLHTRGATTPAKTRWTWLLVVGLCMLMLVEYFSAQSLYAGLSALAPADAQENYQEQMFDQDEVSFYILAVAVAPPVEELLYRGVLYGRMRSINVWLANVVQIVLFTIAHPVITFVPVIAMFAFFQALIFEMTGRLWVCMVAHALANSGLLLLLYSAVGLGIDTIALSVSIPLYLIVWALLVWIYCRVRNSKAPAEEARTREFDEQTRQQRGERTRAKLAAAHVHVTADGKTLVAAPFFYGGYPAFHHGYPAYRGYPAPPVYSPYPGAGYGGSAYPQYRQPFPQTPYPGKSLPQAPYPTQPSPNQPSPNQPYPVQLRSAQPYSVQTYSVQPYQDRTRFMPPAQAAPGASAVPNAPVAVDSGDNDHYHAGADQRGNDQSPVNAEH